MYAADTLRNIIRCALQNAYLWSENAEELLLETAAQESELGLYLHQANGPAMGIYQMEPETLFDRWKNYIPYRTHIMMAFRQINALEPCTRRLTFDPIYSTLMARVKYLPIHEEIPYTRDGRAHYWKDHYNTHIGKGTVEEYLEKCRVLIG